MRVEGNLSVMFIDCFEYGLRRIVFHSTAGSKGARNDMHTNDMFSCVIVINQGCDSCRVDVLNGCKL